MQSEPNVNNRSINPFQTLPHYSTLFLSLPVVNKSKLINGVQTFEPHCITVTVGAVPSRPAELLVDVPNVTIHTSRASSCCINRHV